MTMHGAEFDNAKPDEHVCSLPYDGLDGWFYRCSCGWEHIDHPRAFRFLAHWDWKRHVKGATVR